MDSELQPQSQMDSEEEEKVWSVTSSMDSEEEKEEEKKISSLEYLIQGPGMAAVAQKAHEVSPGLSDVATRFLEGIGVLDAEEHSCSAANAEKHFQALNEIWMDEVILNSLYEESIGENPQVMDNIDGFIPQTLQGLHRSRVMRVRNDPSLKSILDETDPSARMRGAISILIRYWSMEYNLEEYFYSDIGLYAIGLDISFGDSKAATEKTLNLISGGDGGRFAGLPEKRAGPTTLAQESKRSKSTTLPQNVFSPINQLVNVPSIHHLAEDAEKDPRLVEMAGELLKSLEDAHFDCAEPLAPGISHWFPTPLHVRHCEAVWEFWRNQHFRDLFLNHLFEDPRLLVMVKMFSDQFRREVTLDRLEFINSHPLFVSFLDNGGFEMKQPSDRLRCALAIMTLYWGCVGLGKRLRKKRGWRLYIGRDKTFIKYTTDFEDELIGDTTFFRIEDAYCDDGQSDWYEANRAGIEDLLDEEWRDVLTQRYDVDGTRINYLPGEVKIYGGDSCMRLVLEKDSSGSLRVSCSI